MNLRVILEPSDEGGYSVMVPALPGCISEGDTREQALENIHEAIQLYIEPVEDGNRSRSFRAKVALGRRSRGISMVRRHRINRRHRDFSTPARLSRASGRNDGKT